MGPVWYLGERLARQCSRGALTVPVDPPRTMFREPSEAEREADLAGASGDDLLLPGEDYSAFLYGRLAYWPVVVSILCFLIDLIFETCDDRSSIDESYSSFQEVEAAGIEPPEYPETLEYTDATGRTTISELRDFDVAVTDAGLDDWQHLIRRVAPSRFVALWRVANRLRATAIEALVGGRGRQGDGESGRELAQAREETARLSRELEFRDAEIAALMARVAELEGAQQ
ncbi:uncharacterized protein LOC141631235 [Silene latifolia]|uniref:uncharacterized protein LOC141631235 n=1 Tax=Silene latifolia TaxID=37657 RepID=UPI003D77DB3A